MKIFKIKKILALLISTVAMLIAKTSSNMCIFWMLGEVPMPKSLYKR
ncbi:cyclic lactone autoinducer peptide [Clostridium sp. DSM 8431]|nr:cyclic lactone autoinducer peptide [Clostridium sp. DSM 8431]SFU53996.1 cyclic lactone autoinducer peptide [Clostridium sp. DSM 8431]